MSPPRSIRCLIVCLAVTPGLALAVCLGPAGLLSTPAALANGGIHVTSTDPLSQTVGVPLTGTLGAGFDAALNTSTVASRTLAVHGMQGGLLTGAYSFPASDRLVLTPGRALFAGEVVRVSATAGISSATGAALVPYQWQLTAGPVFSRCFAAFGDIGAGLSGVYDSSVAWGDYDNDGDLDILLTGHDGSNPIARVYRNQDCADLAIVKRASPATTLAPGKAVTYTLAFSNAGESLAQGVVITDRVPISVSVQSVVSHGVVITDSGLRPGYAWRVQDLAPGQGGVITLSGVLNRPLPTGVFTNTAVITGTARESRSANNTSQAVVRVGASRQVVSLPIIVK